MLQTANVLRGMTSFRSGALLAVALFAAFAIPPAYAHDSQEAYEMTVIRDAAHGRKVVFGKYDEAIAKIKTLKGHRSKGFFVSNNLCVAYAKTADIDSAARACDEALAVATKERRFDSDHLEWVKRRRTAMALSNRGVLRALSGDRENARQDFQDAIDLNAGLSSPERNLAYLDNKPVETVTSLQTDR
ncbi:MAG: tetratricopeptide repeat protein [Pseudomonadota bacterium]